MTTRMTWRSPTLNQKMSKLPESSRGLDHGLRPSEAVDFGPRTSKSPHEGCSPSSSKDPLITQLERNDERKHHRPPLRQRPTFRHRPTHDDRWPAERDRRAAQAARAAPARSQRARAVRRGMAVDVRCGDCEAGLRGAARAGTGSRPLSLSLLRSRCPANPDAASGRRHRPWSRASGSPCLPAPRPASH